MTPRGSTGTSHGSARRDVLTIVATIVLLGILLLSSISKSFRPSLRIQCIHRLKQVGLAFRIYAHENDERYPQAIPESEGGAKEAVERGEVFRAFQLLTNHLSDPKDMICPSDKRKPASDFQEFNNSNISYFLGLDPVDEKPNMLFAGDRDLAIDGEMLFGPQSLSTEREFRWTKKMHEHSGNILMSDGSVQQVSNYQLNELLKKSGDTNNRVVFPQ